MAFTQNRPAFFDSLEFGASVIADGWETWTAPCGCSQTSRAYDPKFPIGSRATGGGCGVCELHTSWCDLCGQQNWPHNDCVCDQLM